MGQLEKYGLYVLCLVIFLILGVAMWGDPPPDVIDNQLAQQEKTLLSPEEYTAGLDKVLQAQEQMVQERTLDKQRTAEDAAAKLFVPATSANSGRQIEPPVTEEIQPPVASNRTGVALRTHKIVRNDNYGTLAQHYLGSARFDKEIEKANPGIDPRKLQIGMEIKIPEISGETGNTTTSAAPKSRVYTVKSGDSLWKIAERHYGAKRADEFVKRIKEINGLRNDVINPGETIKLPIE